MGTVALPPKSAVERSVVERSEEERSALKQSVLESLAVERMLRDGLLREPAGQGWGGWTQDWGLGRGAPGWRHHLELPR